MSQDLQLIERTKDSFSLEEILEARTKTFEALDRISKAIKVGMREEDAIKMATEIMKSMGAEKFWHRTYVRFGKNTLKGYGEASEPNVILGENDIYFLDIGPVWGEYEGDAGDTYVTGSDPDMALCCSDAREIFNEVKTYWKETGASGTALYEYARQVAENKNWKLNLKIAGHRLSDFPHALYTKMSLADFTGKPSSHIWVLEIQIRHPTKDYSAFYEDLLY